jgi:levanase/fructan beta-fructosidase
MVLFMTGHTFAFFTSENLLDWTRQSDIVNEGAWDCPDMYEMPVEGEPDNRKWILQGGSGGYLLGTFDGKSFNKESGPHLIDFGTNFYAAQTFSNIPVEDGRIIQMAWMHRGEYPGMPFVGQASFPCCLKLRRFDEGLRICREPVGEIRKLYARTIENKYSVIKPGANLPIGSRGRMLDICFEIDPGTSIETGLRIREKKIAYLREHGTLSCLSTTVPGIPSWFRETKDAEGYAFSSFAPVELLDGKIQFRILVDRTSIETFVNQGRYVMTCHSLAQGKTKPFELYAVGGEAAVLDLKIRELQPVWA